MVHAIHMMAGQHILSLYFACGLLVFTGVAEASVIILMTIVATNILGGVELPPIFSDFGTMLGITDTSGLNSQSLLILIASLACRQIVIGLTRTYVYAITPKITTDIRDVVIKNLLSANFSYLDSLESGTFRQVLLQECGRTVAAAQSIIMFTGHIIAILVVLTLMFYMSPQLTILLIIISAPLIPFRLWYAQKLHRFEKKSLNYQFSLTNTLEDLMANLRIIKLVNLGYQFSRKIMKLSLRTMWLRAYVIILHTWDPLILYIGALGIISAIIKLNDIHLYTTTEHLLAFLLISYRVIGPSVGASAEFNNVLTNEPHVIAAMKFFNPVKGWYERQSGEEILQQPIESIEFNGVSFGYNEKVSVIKKITFEAKRGEITVLVGPSGAGKSSISNLMLGMYQRDQGSIILNGDNFTKDIDDVHLNSLRNLIGVVVQDISLLNETIREVIRSGDTNLSNKDIEIAAQQADAHNFIVNLPKGYDTVVGERGILLSVGQRQRLLIAQIFSRKTPILILDEATSSLDLSSERNIYEALEQKKDDCLLFVITHRYSNLKNCKNILVLDNGEICEQGSWGELMIKKGFLYKMINKTV